MKKTELILLGFMISLSLSVFSQSRDYEFKTTPVGEKLQYEVGSDFQFVSFNTQGIKSDIQQKTSVKRLNANLDFKKVSMNSSHQFQGFINKELKSKEVRKILLAEGVDFKVDRHHFKIMGSCSVKTKNQ